MPQNFISLARAKGDGSTVLLGGSYRLAVRQGTH